MGSPIVWLKALQLCVSFGLLILLRLIFPGTLLALTGAAALCYVGAAVLAIRDNRAAVWIAFVFSLIAAAFSSWGVYRYLDNGFDYLSGHFEGRTGVYLPAYLFLLVAAGSVAVIVLHARSWRWMLRPGASGKSYRTRHQNRNTTPKVANGNTSKSSSDS